MGSSDAYGRANADDVVDAGEHEERQASVGTIPRRLNAGMDMAPTRRTSSWRWSGSTGHSAAVVIQ